MLKKRIIPLVLLSGKRTVKGVNFRHFRDTGLLKTALRTYSAQEADEIVFLDIERSSDSHTNLIESLKAASIECFMPLAAGGNINSMCRVKNLLLAGADKVVITSASVKNPSLLQAVSQTFGRQALVGGIDYTIENGEAKVWIDCGQRKTSLTVSQHARALVNLGVGEILLNNIDRDGTKKGFDLVTVKQISSEIPVPVVAAGGAKNFQSLADLFLNSHASGAACGTLFSFGDNSPMRARSFLKNAGIPCRVLK